MILPTKRDLIYAAIAVFCVAAFAFALFFLGYNYAHKSDALTINGLQTKLDAAMAANKANDSVLTDCNKATNDAMVAQAAAEQREKKASDALAAFQQNAALSQQNYQKKVTLNKTKPECAVLQERLCPAALGY